MKSKLFVFSILVLGSSSGSFAQICAGSPDGEYEFQCVAKSTAVYTPAANWEKLAEVLPRRGDWPFSMPLNPPKSKNWLL
jgi:hypothetical protein